MRMMVHAFTRFLLGFTLFIFAILVFFGMPPIVGMEMEKQGDSTMGTCLFEGNSGVCLMTLAEHISKWQSLLTATIPQKLFVLIFVILLITVFVLKKTFKRNLLLLFNKHVIRWRSCSRQNPQMFLFNHLREIFSQGILNPKSY